MKKIILAIVCMVNLQAWEINTHRAIDNFFRGQISAKIDGNKIIVSNLSDTSLVF